MRFRIGRPPEDLSPASQTEWVAIQFHPVMLQLAAVPVGLLIAFGLVHAWALAGPGQVSVELRSLADVAWAGLSLATLFVIHEMLHCLAHPAFGFSRQSVIGFSIGGFMPYAVYLGEMGRRRTVLVGLMPFVGLSVLPLLACLGFSADCAWAAVVSVINGFGSGGDCLIVWLILRNAPRGAVLRDSGWKMWWRSVQSDNND